jgi:hypothetical protein
MGAELRRYFEFLLIVVVLLVGAGNCLRAQDEPRAPADSTTSDSAAAPKKSRLQQAIEAGERAAEQPDGDTSFTPASTLSPTSASNAEQLAVQTAVTWVHRLLFRGWLNPTVIGGFATYQLTSWGEGSGSYGPVDGKLTIHYLGSAEWNGKDAEWLQAAFYTMQSDPELIEFDLIVPANQRVTEVYRALYRVDRGELRPITFAPASGAGDVDASDRPVEMGAKSVHIYAGDFECKVYRGNGNIGSDVLVYRDEDISPLEVVVLGYGDEGLTFSATGSEVTPRFSSPPPPPAPR